MPVFRVEKTNSYTVMSNHHLRNPDLTLKAKGLLSLMLSLPENWDYTLKGLSCICRENVDAIRTAVWELEKAGYITRRQGRDEKGKMTAIEYTIYEFPQPPKPKKPVLENPISDNPTTEIPISENPTQLNKDRSTKDLLNTDVSSTYSIPFQKEAAAPQERKGNGYTNMDAVRAYAVLVNEMVIATNLHSAIFSIAAYTVILCFSLFKTGNLAKSIFHAH